MFHPLCVPFALITQMAHDWLCTFPLGVECAGAPAPPPGVWRADGPRCPPSGVVLCGPGRPPTNRISSIAPTGWHAPWAGSRCSGIRVRAHGAAGLTVQRRCSHEDGVPSAGQRVPSRSAPAWLNLGDRGPGSTGGPSTGLSGRRPAQLRTRCHGRHRAGRQSNRSAGCALTRPGPCRWPLTCWVRRRMVMKALCDLVRSGPDVLLDSDSPVRSFAEALPQTRPWLTCPP